MYSSKVLGDFFRCGRLEKDIEGAVDSGGLVRVRCVK